MQEAKYKIGMEIDELPKKKKFLGGSNTIFYLRGWDALMKNKPNRWIVLETEKNGGKRGGSKSGRLYGLATNYNKRYGDAGFQFAVRNEQGFTYLFGRYENALLTTPTTDE